MPIEVFCILTIFLTFMALLICIAAYSKIGAIIAGCISTILLGWAFVSNITTSTYLAEEVKVVLVHDRATFLHDDKIYNANGIFDKQFKEGQIIQIMKYKPSLGLYSRKVEFCIKDEKCEN